MDLYGDICLFHFIDALWNVCAFKVRLVIAVPLAAGPCTGISLGDWAPIVPFRMRLWRWTIGQRDAKVKTQTFIRSSTAKLTNKREKNQVRALHASRSLTSYHLRWTLIDFNAWLITAAQSTEEKGKQSNRKCSTKYVFVHFIAVII